MSLWHPNAIRITIPSAPQDLLFTGGGKKLVWHTTEGSGIDGAVAAYKANGDCPHFTIQVHNGKRTLYQHLPLDRAASALRHLAGTRATNTANCIQVEIVGFAKDSSTWPEAMYKYLTLLAQYVHQHFGTPLTTKVSWRDPQRLSEEGFIAYEGHLGHMHVPNNDHVDPGTGFHIGKIL